MAKSASAKYRTPAGIFSYPHLNKPDTKFDKEGKYHVDLLLSKDKARDFVKLCKELAAEEWGPAKAKTAQMPWKISKEDPDTVVISAKAKADYPPSIANIEGVKVDPKKLPMVGTGTKGKLSIRLKANEVSGKFYVTSYLLSAQIIKLVEYGEDTGFDSARDELDEDEEGFQGPDDSTEFGTAVTEQSVDADAGEYEDDPDNLEDDEEDEDF